MGVELPTTADILEHGSYEAAVNAQKPPRPGAALDLVVSTAEPKGSDMERELDAIVRQLDGLKNRLERLKASL